MKLQMQVSRKIGDAEYVKWVFVLPQDRITQLGLKEALDLFDEVKGDSLCIRAARSTDKVLNKEEPIYSDFKNSIKNILERYRAGLTWSEIKDKLNYAQKAPNNKWVSQLEADIGLKRIRSGGKMVWKLEQYTIYTIGYEGLDIIAFVKKLKDSNIQQLIDVREIALSRKNGFSKGVLRDSLKQGGVRYQHLSMLGSPRELRHELHRDWNYEKFFTEYRQHITDPDIQDGITQLEGLSKLKRTAILCFEKDPATCHRNIIGEELKKRGWRIGHIT